MSFFLYVIGLIVFVTGLASIAAAVGVSQAYILAGVAAILGIALLVSLLGVRAKVAS